MHLVSAEIHCPDHAINAATAATKLFAKACCRARLRDDLLRRSRGVVKDIYQLLREKEQRIEQLRREVEALRAVAPMLADQSDPAAKAILTDSPGPR